MSFGCRHPASMWEKQSHTQRLYPGEMVWQQNVNGEIDLTKFKVKAKRLYS